MIKDRLGDVLSVGDFILYVTKTEAPSIQFAWVEEFKNKGSSGNVVRIKIAHANPDGTRRSKVTWVYDPIEGTSKDIDTGKPSVVWLESYGQQDNRFMKFQPI